MAKVTVLNCWAAEQYALPVPVVSFNEWNGLEPGQRTPTHSETITKTYSVFIVMM